MGPFPQKLLLCSCRRRVRRYADGFGRCVVGAVCHCQNQSVFLLPRLGTDDGDASDGGTLKSLLPGSGTSLIGDRLDAAGCCCTTLSPEYLSIPRITPALLPTLLLLLLPVPVPASLHTPTVAASTEGLLEFLDDDARCRDRDAPEICRPSE